MFWPKWEDKKIFRMLVDLALHIFCFALKSFDCPCFHYWIVFLVRLTIFAIRCGLIIDPTQHGGCKTIEAFTGKQFLEIIQRAAVWQLSGNVFVQSTVDRNRLQLLFIPFPGWRGFPAYGTNCLIWDWQCLL